MKINKDEITSIYIIKTMQLFAFNIQYLCKSHENRGQFVVEISLNSV